jgi:hypothetical protein
MGSKYKNQRCTCQQGYKHLSRAEATYCNLLQARQRNGDFVSFRHEPAYALRGLNGDVVGVHKPDFELVFVDGHKEVHEVKGMVTQAWRLKHELFKATYPDIKYVVVDARRMGGSTWRTKKVPKRWKHSSRRAWTRKAML